MKLRIFAALLSLPACFESGGGSSEITLPTLIAVDPQDFLGEVSCGESPGALARYVATVVDVTPGLASESFALPSSGPVRCNQKVGSGFVVPGHQYVTTVAGYSTAAITPLSVGSPVMVDVMGSAVPPTWLTRCGGSANPDQSVTSVTCIEFATRHTRACTEFKALTGSKTGISVTLAGALRDLQCGTGPGQVSRFAVTASASTQALEAGCGELVEFLDLMPGVAYEFSVSAFTGDSSRASFGTTCFQTAAAGVVLQANCDPLLSVGALAVDTQALLQQFGKSCGSDVKSLTFALLGANGPVVQTVGAPCATVQFDGLAPGAFEITVTSELVDGKPGPDAHCEGIVAPGQRHVAACEVLPAPAG